MKLDRLSTMPDWPARMTSDVAALFMCVSETTFLARYGSLGYKEGSNTFWARAALEAAVAKQSGMVQPSSGWDV